MRQLGAQPEASAFSAAYNASKLVFAPQNKHLKHGSKNERSFIEQVTMR